MHRYSLFYLALVVPVWAFGQQHVVRFGLDPKNRSGTMLPNSCSSVYAPQTMTGDPCDVAVYDAAETDRRLSDQKQALDTKITSLEEDLRQQIKILKENIKTLADMNDSLTQRLNRMEAKMSEKDRLSRIPSLAERVGSFRRPRATQPRAKALVETRYKNSKATNKERQNSSHIVSSVTRLTPAEEMR